MATKKGSKSKKPGQAAKRSAAKATAAKGAKKSTKSAKRSSTKGAARGARPGRVAAAPEGGRPHRGAVSSSALPGNFNALYDRGFREARGAMNTPTETEGHRQLDREVEGLCVHYDHATQLPKLITVTPQRTGRAAALPTRGCAAATPEGAVTRFIEQHGNLWKLMPEDAATVGVVSVSQLRS